MDLKELYEKRDYLNQYQTKLLTCQGIECDKTQKQILLHDKMNNFNCELTSEQSIEAKNQLRIRNCRIALEYMKQRLESGSYVDENMVKDLHGYLMTDIIVGGIYRNTEVLISNTDYIPPAPQMAYDEIKYYYYVLEQMKNKENTIKIATYSLFELLNIHPFTDGNGRIARAVMNYQLLRDDFYPIVIKKKDRDKYINTIEACREEKNTSCFEDMVYDLQNERLEHELQKIKKN